MISKERVYFSSYRLQNVSVESYVCIEEIPHIRELQHVLYDKITHLIDKEIPPLIMEFQDYDNKDKLKTLGAILAIREAINGLCGDAYTFILQELKSRVQILVDISTPEVIPNWDYHK